MPAMILLPDNTDVLTLKNVVTNIFKDCFRYSLDLQIIDWLANFPSLQSLEVFYLKSLSQKKKSFSLKNANGDKIPGPDVFPF